MFRTFATRQILLALAVLLSAPGARGDTQRRTRVTIRGTGSDVTIERTEAPVPEGPAGTAAAPAEALGNAIRLKSRGAADAVVIAYLRAHEAEFPPVIDAQDLRQLRKAGAGKAVVAYLATIAAVDIGETGEGRGAVVSNAPLPEIETGTPSYDMSYGYPLAGGYVAPHAARRRASVFSLRRAPFPRGQPVLRRSLPSRAMPGRRPIE